LFDLLQPPVSKFSFQHSILKRSQSLIFLKHERPSLHSNDTADRIIFVCDLFSDVLSSTGPSGMKKS
jgi:hypothetical protein